ncbi:MAG TPA: nucleotide exchange factor GrpE [Euzebyales bacterium]|nr:nucleotide exchange factor GrpE [Euzebyales bacterium]
MTDAPKDHDAGAADAQTAPDGAAGETAVDGQPVTGSDGADASGGQVDPALAGVTAALEQVTRERDTYLDHLRRERAEFENFRRRSQKERMEALDRGAEALAVQLLSVLDNFGYVLEAAKDADDAVAKGVRMVHTELREVLERAGLEDVPGVDAPFDPTWHDAVMQVDGETTDDGEPRVAQVLRNGYRFKGRVLRPATVAVTQ